MNWQAGEKSTGIRVLVVDDSAYNRKMIRAMLLDMDEIRATDAVSDGEEAIKVVMTDPPDVITLDLNMPRMDGFTFLRWLMRNNPLPVIVVSSEGGEKNVFKALDLGALDFVVKPVRYASERIVEIKTELQEKIRATAGRDLLPYLNRLKVKKPSVVVPPVRMERPSPADARGGILVIGASTGGPSAIQRVLSDIPAEYPLPVVVVQHMPPVFTRQFAQRLRRNVPLDCKEAEDGDLLVPGKIFVAPGGFHLVVGTGDERVLNVVEKKTGDRFIPSVDITMSSAAKVYGPATIGVILTGMGNDGTRGLLEIGGAGGRTIAESEDSAVVFGMPRAAAQSGAVQAVEPIDRIAARVLDFTKSLPSLKKDRSDDTN